MFRFKKLDNGSGRMIAEMEKDGIIARCEVSDLIPDCYGVTGTLFKYLNNAIEKIKKDNHIED